MAHTDHKFWNQEADVHTEDHRTDLPNKHGNFPHMLKMEKQTEKQVT
jgi:hypothetical protein